MQEIQSMERKKGMESYSIQTQITILANGEIIVRKEEESTYKTIEINTQENGLRTEKKGMASFCFLQESNILVSGRMMICKEEENT